MEIRETIGLLLYSGIPVKMIPMVIASLIVAVALVAGLIQCVKGWYLVAREKLENLKSRKRTNFKKEQLRKDEIK